MAKIRIYTIAKELGIENSEMLSILDDLDIPYKSVSSTIEEETVELIKGLVSENETPVAEQPVAQQAEAKTQAKDAVVDDAAQQSAEGKQTVSNQETKSSTPAKANDDQSNTNTTNVEFPHRAPVVTIMGHVDHGKTSLLDYIREAKVAAKEAGGITQHVGAFEAETSRGKVVFIDTPGHEAFTSIRARGANVADIAIIVIAADDSLMPQTREAIAHAQAAKVPMIVAINKVDLPQANIEKVKADLTAINLVPEDYGGDLVTVPVSAKSGEGVEDLLEYISLTAELEDLRANPEGEFAGVIIESKVDKQAGVLATVMVQQGQLNVGDFLVVGENYGKIKAMTDSAGKRIKSAGPSTPVQVLGFSDSPNSGELVSRASDEHAARDLIATREEQRREEENARKKPKLSLDDILGPLNEVHTVNLILRADTQGSLEAIQGILAKKETDDVKLNVMFAGIGAPSESDVLLASTAEATILCFSVNPSGSVKKAAENKDIDLKSYRIIYEMIDEVDRLIKGNLDPVYEEQYLGRAEVRMIIHHPKSGNIAGSYITDGMFKRGAKAIVTRGKEVVYEGDVVGLKRFKDDVREVRQGLECGINLGWDDVQEGDIIEASEMVEVEQ